MLRILLVNCLFTLLLVRAEDEENVTIAPERYVMEYNYLPAIFGSNKYNAILQQFEIPEELYSKTTAVTKSDFYTTTEGQETFLRSRNQNNASSDIMIKTNIADSINEKSIELTSSIHTLKNSDIADPKEYTSSNTTKDPNIADSKNHTSSVNMTKDSNTVDAKEHTSSVNMTKDSNTVDSKEHTSSVNMRKDSNMEDSKEHTSSLNTTRDSDFADSKEHTSSANTTKDSSESDIMFNESFPSDKKKIDLKFQYPFNRNLSFQMY